MTGPAALLRGDAVHIPLRDDSVDLIVTSPPYFSLRSYADGGEHYDGQIGSEATPQAFLAALWAVTVECRRVLKPSGSLWVNLGDKYSGSGGNNNSNLGERATKRGPSSYNKASDVPAKSLMGLPWRYAIGCIDQLDLILRAEVVWSKPNGLPESVTDRVRRSHEQWFRFTKEPRYYAAVDEVREAHLGVDNAKSARGPSGTNRSHMTGKVDGVGNFARDPLGKLPGSVWTIPSEPLQVPEHLGVDHFAAFPQEWPRRIILGWSPPGICTRCGDGRRPVVEKELAESPEWRARQREGCGWGSDAGSTLGTPAADRSTTITGYACACPDTDAPTRPAVVFDPFGGTGTVAMVARALGRYAVHLDLSADYLRLADWRIHQSGHANKTVDRTNRERQGTLL